MPTSGRPARQRRRRLPDGREITVAPAAGQSPEDLAQDMDLSEEQRRSPTLFDPGFVYVWAHPNDGQLVIEIGYQ